MPEHVNAKISCVLIILIVINFVPLEMGAIAATRNWHVEFSNNELAADIDRAPLGVILEEICKGTGIEFFLERSQSERIISVKFGFLPLEKALARIIGKVNHAIVFGADGKILSVTVVGTNKSFPLGVREPFADDLFPETGMNTEEFPEVGTEDRGREEDYEITVDPVLAAGEMPTHSPSGEEMEIPSPSDAEIIVIDPPGGEEMAITDSSTTMVIEP